MTAEDRRLEEHARRERNWKRWGPYLAERQWSTVREDYSAHGGCWAYFPHDHARSRAYRWGEDGLLGICDRECRLCFALALWNERDPILKERLFGLTGPEGNHGEDVKECYFYLDSTPTHSYVKTLYKYPYAEFPYARLVEENGRRSRDEREFELLDTGVLDEQRYFDVTAEYAKASPDDILVRITVANRGPETATLHVLPTLWFRNTWSWGRTGEGYWPKPRIQRAADTMLVAEHASLGRFRLALPPQPGGATPEILFTDNERLFAAPNATPYVKDAFHACVIEGRRERVNAEGIGTKAAPHYRLEVPAGREVALRLRLFAESEAPGKPLVPDFDRVFAERVREAEEFFAQRTPPPVPEECVEPEKLKGLIVLGASTGRVDRLERVTRELFGPVVLDGAVRQKAVNPPKTRLVEEALYEIWCETAAVERGEAIPVGIERSGDCRLPLECLPELKWVPYERSRVADKIEGSAEIEEVVQIVRRPLDDLARKMLGSVFDVARPALDEARFQLSEQKRAHLATRISPSIGMERDREALGKADRPQGDTALQELARSVSERPDTKRASRFARRVMALVPPLVAARVAF
jgi:hypothetical protein